MGIGDGICYMHQTNCLSNLYVASDVTFDLETNSLWSES